MTKTQANNAYILKKRRQGKEHIFTNQLPYPEFFSRCDGVLGVNGVIIYLKTHENE